MRLEERLSPTNHESTLAAKRRDGKQGAWPIADSEIENQLEVTHMDNFGIWDYADQLALAIANGARHGQPDTPIGPDSRGTPGAAGGHGAATRDDSLLRSNHVALLSGLGALCNEC